MPQITVTNTITKLPGEDYRKKLVFVNTGSQTAYWGWESDVAESGAKQGIPLPPQDATTGGPAVVLDALDASMHRPIYFKCSAGQSTTITYTGLV